jgi:hypothetical protein
VESVHVPAATSLSDALALARIAGRETTQVRFRIGWDFRDVLASLLGRELKDACDALPGRLIVHMIFGSGEPSLNVRSAGEFIANCRALFRELEAPAFHVEGETAEAAFVAIQQADCLWRLPHRPNRVYADALPVLHFGKEAGLLTWVIGRESRQEALEAAASLLPDHATERLDDPACWIGPDLWTGTASGRSGKMAALVGSFEEIARAVHGFKSRGISQILVREWPGRHETVCFGERVMPLIRALEQRKGAPE